MPTNKNPGGSGRGGSGAHNGAGSNGSLPVYSARGKVIAQVRGGELVKNVRAEHFLQRPPALAFDRCAIEQAQALGATRIRVNDKSSGKVYRVSMARFLSRAFAFNRGFGAQLGLRLVDWDGGAPEPAQLALWGNP